MFFFQYIKKYFFENCCWHWKLCCWRSFCFGAIAQFLDENHCTANRVSPSDRVLKMKFTGVAAEDLRTGQQRRRARLRCCPVRKSSAATPVNFIFRTLSLGETRFAVQWFSSKNWAIAPKQKERQQHNFQCQQQFSKKYFFMYWKKNITMGMSPT